MADKSILTPGYQEVSTSSVEESTGAVQYLEKDNCLSEFSTAEEKAQARTNLQVPSFDDIPKLADLFEFITQKVTGAISAYNLEELRESVTDLQGDSENFVKKDGSVKFERAPQVVKNTIFTTDEDLITKGYVATQLKKYLKLEDIPEEVFQQIEITLKDYALTKDIKESFKNYYTKEEIDQNKQIVRTDGSTPFTQPQQGIKPQRPYHLATKGYVDEKMTEHLIDPDPHNFSTILANRLVYYIKKTDVYDKTQTYSRTQIDDIVYRLVNQAVGSSIEEYVNSINEKLENIRKERFVKQDGSIPFRAPQAGVDAIDSQDLVTLHQVEEKVENLQEQITNNEPIWRTSGPVESTVGHIDDNTPVPATMTLQEVLDAIFYGKGISISAPDYVTINNKVPVTLCVHGSTGLIDVAELYQDGELIVSFVKEDFENGCVTVDSLPIMEDTEITFKVTYTNGAVHEESITVKVALPTFVGLLPKWKFGSVVTWNYLEELASEEPNNNQFINSSNNLNQISINYSFQDAKLRRPFVVVPVSYPNLDNMSTASQKFGLDAFDVIDMIPLQVPGVEKDIIFKIYIYRQALSSLNQEITFNFA